MAMSDRAWRQTRSSGTAVREIYPSDGNGNEFFKLPSLVKVFTVTIPDGTFNAGTFVPFLLGVVEFRANYKFSQRRTDINDLVSGMVALKEDAAREDEREKIRQKFISTSESVSGDTPKDCKNDQDSGR